MIKKIFKAIFLATIGVFLACLFLIMGVLYRYFSTLQLEQLRTQTTLAAQGISLEGKEYLEDLNTSNVRITWVDNLGNVLYDSHSNALEMENHSQRAEIKEALLSGYGESSRYSPTLTQNSLYSAKRLDNGTIVRLSVSQRSIFLIFLGMLQPFTFIFLIAIGLSLIIARHISKKIIAPLNTMDLDKPLTNITYEEISPFLRRINYHQEELRKQKQLLEQQKEEFNTIVSKIKEGFLLLDKAGRIISINQTAQTFFDIGTSYQGKDFLQFARNISLIDNLKEALLGKKKEVKIEKGDFHYQVMFRPVFSDGQLTGLVILMFDITEQEQIEQMRREFTANVSHELKTPLQTISGYSEILKNKLVAIEDIPQFSEKIFMESQRLIHLIEDIIRLSHLDENSSITMQPVNLFQLAQNVLDSLLLFAMEKKVKLKLTGEKTKLFGNPLLLYSIIYNLSENAIKYNRQGGTVLIDISEKDKEIVLTVKDTGIGIPQSEQDRIFERFYRIDKSRTQKDGGTGLGLSIVKHAALLHKAKIKVISRIDEGTEISVVFNKSDYI